MGAWMRLSPVAEKRNVVTTGCGSGTTSSSETAGDSASVAGGTASTMRRGQRRRESSADTATSRTPSVYRVTLLCEEMCIRDSHRDVLN